MQRCFGALTVGRQYTPYYLALSTVGDPFAAGMLGTAKNLFPTAGVNTHTSNTLYYLARSGRRLRGRAGL